MNDDPFPSSPWQLTRAPSARRVCAGLTLTIALLSGLAGTFEIMRAMKDSFVYAERVCARVGPPNVPDSGERQTCLRRAHAGAPWSAAYGYWTFAGLVFIAGVVLIVLDARREGVG